MSLREAINEKCKECIYDPISGRGTWRNQVLHCSSMQCPLYSVRPKPTVTANQPEIVDSTQRIVPICSCFEPSTQEAKDE